MSKSPGVACSCSEDVRVRATHPPYLDRSYIASRFAGGPELESLDLAGQDRVPEQRCFSMGRKWAENREAMDGFYRKAAVLVPIIDEPEGLSVLLTRRSDSLRHHAGQVSFPGGCTEPEDESAEATAIREAEEEIDLPREKVTLLGRLDICRIVSGFSVTPCVALVKPPLDLHANPAEVAEIFHVPLGVVMDPKRYVCRRLTANGRLESCPILSYGGHDIWGATAAILFNLHRFLRKDPGAEN